MRNKIIDYMKGIAIFLVVLAHTNFPYLKYITLFHMPVFFIFSGYCHRDSYSDDLKSIILFIKKRLKSLYVPYVLFNLILLCLHNLLYKFNFYTDNPLFVESNILFASYGKIGMYSAKDFIYHLVLTIGFVDGEQLAGTLWFLRALFEISILYVLIDWFAKKSRLYKTWIVCIISVIIMLIGYILKTYNIHIVTGVEETCYYFIFFTIGVLLQKVDFKKRLPDMVTVIISAICLFISYCLLIYSLIPNAYAPIFYVTNGCLGGLLIKGLAGILMRTRIAGFIEYMGKNSLHIMLWHFPVFKLVSLCYIRIYNLPAYYLASFPVLKTQYLWIAYSFVGTVVPLLAVYLIRLTKEHVSRD